MMKIQTKTTPRLFGALAVGMPWAVLYLVWATAVPAKAQTTIGCTEPNMLVLFDVSGSMGKAQEVPASKYDVAQQAIHYVTQMTEEEIRYGLMFFPEPGEYPVRCGMGTSLAVDMNTGNWQAIYNQISPTLYGSDVANPEFFGGPRGDFDTPMYQALQAAQGNPGLQDSSRRNYVLLLTDGVQDCCLAGDYDDEIDCDPTKSYLDPDYHIPAEYEENRQDLIALVTAMESAGIGTFVVGFGDRVDAITLDALARAGGTAQAGCTGDGAGDCYYQADDGDELMAALQAIAAIAQDEVCDNLDNDCDGEIDEPEDTDLLCSTACGSGYAYCVDGEYTSCDAPPVFEEICDGVDNDCDGQTDEGCECINGQSQACGTQIGACELGSQTCVDGQWSACAGGTQPTAEACDGNTDEDCDGLVDEGCACTNGATQDCGTDEGECESGTQTCVGGLWGPCSSDAMPALTDACDGLDNDCDGMVDEHCDCTDGETRACGSSLGVCESGYQECIDGGWSPCVDSKGGTSEICNLIDDDCDGEVDDRALCPPATECRCGACVGACGADGSCPLDARCMDGACVVSQCPEGSYCDGHGCVPGEDPNIGQGQDFFPEDGGSGPMSGVDKGCDCSSTSASPLLPLLVLMGLWAALRRRRGLA